MKKTVIEVLPSGELFAGRFLSVETYRDDQGYVIMCRAELLPQRIRCPRLGLDALRTELTIAENRLQKICHPKSFGLSPGGTGALEQRKTMQTTMKVRSERPDSYQGKKGIVNSVIIALDDCDTSDQCMLNSIDYTLSEEEKIMHAGKLHGKIITLGIRDITLFGGRIRARGRIISVK